MTKPNKETLAVTPAITDEATFVVALATIKGQLSGMKGAVQDCVVYGLAHYLQHSGDTSQLSRVMQVIDENIGKQLGRTLKGYIQAHANVRWTKVDDGSYKFKKSGKGLEVKELVGLWFEFEGANSRTMPDLSDPLAQLRAWLERMKEKETTGLVHPSRAGLVDSITARLEDMLALPDVPKAQLFSTAAE